MTYNKAAVTLKKQLFNKNCGYIACFIAIKNKSKTISREKSCLLLFSVTTAKWKHPYTPISETAVPTNSPTPKQKRKTKTDKNNNKY